MTMSSLKCSITKQLLLITRRRINSFIHESRSQARNYCAVPKKEILSSSNTLQKHRKFIPFFQLMKSRREEADRSVVIQVRNENSYHDLISYCLDFGSVKNAFYFDVLNNDKRNQFILLEFDDVSGKQSVLESSCHLEKESVVPVHSPFLWFRLNFKAPKLKSDVPKLTIESNSLPTPSELKELLLKSNSFSDDMTLLYEHTKLSEVGTRLRFIAASQLENALKGLFPSSQVLPFGSSVNNFGKISSDLDLVLELSEFVSSTDSRLVFHSKGLSGSNKIHNQKHLEIFADMVQYFLPGCSNTRRILRARIPIIRYKHDIAGVDCDLSSSNLSGVYMSELLYIFAKYDWRVCPLVFTVRYWARQTNLTNPAPGKWVTNFTLTLLVLFYLQCEKIIPTIETLMQQKRPEDEKVFEDENNETINCGFLSDIRLLQNAGTVHNNDSLAELLMKFFNFFSTFDFRSNAISLNTGNIFTKPYYHPMYIVNPLEKALNVSRNVSMEECERVRMQFKNAFWNMECSSNPADNKTKWGLHELIDSYLINKSSFPNSGMKPTRVAIKDIFLDD